MKKIYKSNTDKVFTGLLGGIAKTFNISSFLLRFLVVIIALFTFIIPCLIIYFIASHFVKNEDEKNKIYTTWEEIE